MKKIWRYSLITIAILICLALAALAAGFFAVRYNLTKISGQVDPNSYIYEQELNHEKNINLETLPVNKSIFGDNEYINWCKIDIAANYSLGNAKKIFQAYIDSHSEVLLRRMLLALSLRIPNRAQFEKELLNCESQLSPIISRGTLADRLSKESTENLFAWQNYEPWSIIRQGLTKDMPTIYAAADAAGVQPRLLVSVAIVEQLRLYYTQRELFEKFFKPLKILANANKMAWGVMSIKEPMAMQTESHLKDTKSPFYLGKEYENLLDFPKDANISRLRYNRLTDEKNHYYSYLYGALIIKQIETQWEKAGFPIIYRPELVATLFNIGFNNSKPKENPSVGGSTISIEGVKYYFGSLAYEFYYSGDLINEFPYK